MAESEILKLAHEIQAMQQKLIDLLCAHAIEPLSPSTISAVVPVAKPDYSGLPAAVAVDLLTDSQERERLRGQQVAALVAHQLAPQIVVEQMPIPKAILDFGCGDGYVTEALGKYFSRVVGFDCQGNSGDRSYFRIADDRQLLASGPYDFIVLYDVLDHYQGDLDHLAGMLRGLLAVGGRIFLHCHPWTSIHGGHQYLNAETNFSLLHLIATDEELQSFGLPFVRKITRPLKSYESFVDKLSMIKISRQIRHTPVQAFAACFDLYGEQICRHFPDTTIAEIKRIISIETVGYLLEKRDDGLDIHSQ